MRKSVMWGAVLVLVSTVAYAALPGKPVENSLNLVGAIAGGAVEMVGNIVGAVLG